MCPYARFQSVMVDPNTFVVTYDTRRGEPRGGRSRKIDPQSAGLGDCVDCTLCVQVCPTGIDIRDGLQYMCIGCGACIDACDAVMQKVDYPKGLIRYTSERAMQQGESAQQARAHLLRPRVLIYSGLLLALIIAFLASLLFLRNPVRMDVLRDRGVLGREVPGGMIENVYRLQIINTSSASLRVSLSAQGLPELAVLAGQPGSGSVDVEPMANRLAPMVIRMPAGKGEAGVHPIQLRAHAVGSDGSQYSIEESSAFYIPQ